MDIAKSTKDESANSFKGANSSKNGGNVVLQHKLHPSFKVYILMHLFRDLVKKHMKKPFRKLDRIRRLGYSCYSEYASD